jgi:hypothetical protein
MATSVTTRAAGTLNPTRQQLDELDALLQRMLELPVHPLEKPEQAKAEEPAEEPPPPPRKTESAKRKAEKEAAALPQNTYRLPPTATASISYTVVETASPRPLPLASGFEPRPSLLKPRLVPVSPPPPEPPAVPPPVAEAGEGEAWVPLRSTWQPSASTWPPLAASWHQAQSGATPPAVPAPIVELHPSPAPQPVAAELPSSPIAPAAAVPELPAPVEENDAPAAEARLSLPAEDGSVAVSWPMLPLVWFNQGFDACLASLGAPGRWLCGRGRAVLGFLGLVCLAAAVAIAVNTGMGWSR